MRGILTKQVQEISIKHIGRKIDVNELRLLPYVQYVMMNEKKLDIAKMNFEDRQALTKWRKEDFIEGGASGLSITKEFWDFMNEVLFQSYVAQDGEVEK